MVRLLLLLAMFLFCQTHVLAFQIVVGTYAGDGGDNKNVTISPACQPMAVILQRTDAAWGGQIMISTMGVNSSSDFNGTVHGSADRIQQMNSDGFQVGTEGYVNASGGTYAYVAFCDNGFSDIAVGTYTGNATDDRSHTISPSFQPEFVLVIARDSGVHMWRGASSHSGDSASVVNAALQDLANYIQAFAADEFQVGTGLNQNTVAYHYLALKASAGAIATGNFVGNTSDSRDITAPNFQPVAVFLKGDSATAGMAIRFGHSGDNSFCHNAAQAANQIQSLISTGFQVGTATCANENTVTMRWAAFTSVLATGHPTMRRWGGVYGMSTNLTGRGGF